MEPLTGLAGLLPWLAYLSGEQGYPIYPQNTLKRKMNICSALSEILRTAHFPVIAPGTPICSAPFRGKKCLTVTRVHR